MNKMHLFASACYMISYNISKKVIYKKNKENKNESIIEYYSGKFSELKNLRKSLRVLQPRRSFPAVKLHKNVFPQRTKRAGKVLQTGARETRRSKTLAKLTDKHQKSPRGSLRIAPKSCKTQKWDRPFPPFSASGAPWNSQLFAPKKGRFRQAPIRAKLGKSAKSPESRQKNSELFIDFRKPLRRPDERPDSGVPQGRLKNLPVAIRFEMW